jgi:hypothetical protein
MKLEMEPQLGRINAQTAQLQGELWSVVQAAAAKQPTYAALLPRLAAEDSRAIRAQVPPRPSSASAKAIPPPASIFLELVVGEEANG